MEFAMRVTIWSWPLTAAVISCVVLAISIWDSAIAAATPPQVFSHSRTNGERPTGEQYFVEFRSRPGYVFGHTFIRYGHLDARGKPLEIRIAGIYPLQGQQGLIIGSIIPVPASVQGVKEDIKEAPTNIYRRKLSADQYSRLKVAVRHLRATEHHWHLVFSNCNDFAIDIANALGMHTPLSWLPPAAFIEALHAMNEH
jgi:hypothetical protein